MVVKKEVEMREIKFRAWDKSNNRMLESIFGLKGVPVPVELDGDRCIVMQYTGLKDKKGVEIYESDVVIYCDAKSIVKWNNRDACFDLDGADWVTNCWVENEIEVVSNIYEAMLE